MKALFSLLLALFMVCKAPLEAGTLHTTSISGSDITISIEQPDDLLETEPKDLDFAFYDPENSGRKFFFHYFLSHNFSVSSFNDITAYVGWLSGQAFHSQDCYKNSFQLSPEGSILSFITKDEEDRELYCCVYVGKIENTLVFSAIMTSHISPREASQDMDRLLKGIRWTKSS